MSYPAGVHWTIYSPSVLISFILLLVTSYKVFTSNHVPIHFHVRITAILSMSCYLVSIILYMYAEIKINSHNIGIPYYIVPLMWDLGI